MNQSDMITSNSWDSAIGVGTITARLKGQRYKFLIPSRYHYDTIIGQHNSRTRRGGRWISTLKLFKEEPVNGV